MTIHVIGHSRDLGEYLYEQFNTVFKNTEVCGYSRSNGYNITNDVVKICHQIEPDDLVILNAHADGIQKYYLQHLLQILDVRVVVMGSIASTFPDTDMQQYSREKKELEEYFEKTVLDGHRWLYLKLTGKSYKDYSLIWNTIMFWYNNPNITQVGFNV